MNKSVRLEHRFPEFINDNSEILILGSFPSVKSREQSFYYMHGQNRFWKLLGLIFEDDFENPDIDIKKSLLKKHKIALYDVIESCKIIGSQDSTISDVIPSDIHDLIKNTKINKIFLNGKKAYDLFIEHNPEIKGKYLPSTSSANARYKIHDLYNKWKIIKF